MTPLFKVYVSPRAHAAVQEVLDSGFIGEGPKVAEFTDKFSEYIGNPNVVMVQSGTAAITIALRLAGVGYGDYVVTTPVTCLATNTPILSLGAHPIWADIYSDGTIDPESVEHLMDPDVKAIICMDWGGTPCMLHRLRRIADKWGVALIHDACQSIGSTYSGSWTIGSSPAHYVCTSFQAIKYLTTGDGGALIVNTGEDKLHEARLMKWFGLDRTKSESLRCGQNPPVWGYKYQMNDIAASIGIANLEDLPTNLARVQDNAALYYRELYKCKHVTPSHITGINHPGYWLYTCFVESVTYFSKYMYDNGVVCSKVHDRNDTKTIFNVPRTYSRVVEFFDNCHVCIPVGWWVTPDEAQRIVELCHNYTGDWDSVTGQ